jgi:2',3'-cyclic-nucleotide 2'-phosphodiesterase (5'-nucleotidase family)
MNTKRLLGILVLIVLSSTLSAGEPEKVVILFTNDIEGYFEPRGAFWMNPDFPPPLGGVEAAYNVFSEEFKAAEREGYPLLVLDCGGIAGGDMLGIGTDFDRSLEFMNTIGYDAMALGVRDFVHGVEGVRKIDRDADFPLLGANITLAEDTLTHPDFVKPFEIFEVSGVRIGVFGLISDYMEGIYNIHANTEGLFFLREIQTAERMVETLRDEGVDAIVCLAHTGYEHQLWLMEAVRGIDLIIGGFDGRGLREAMEDPVTHTVLVRGYSGLSAIGRVDMAVDPEYGVVTSLEYQERSLLLEEAPSSTMEDYFRIGD